MEKKMGAYVHVSPRPGIQKALAEIANQARKQGKHTRKHIIRINRAYIFKRKNKLNNHKSGIQSAAEKERCRPGKTYIKLDEF